MLVQTKFRTSFDGFNVSSFFYDELTVVWVRLGIAIRKLFRLHPKFESRSLWAIWLMWVVCDRRFEP